MEPSDVELLYQWENDPALWHVSGTLAPLSRHQLEAFIEAQQYELFRSGQQRLIIENRKRNAVGAVDLFEIDPLNRRAGVGMLIYGEENRRKRYAQEALDLLIEYAEKRLNLHQLWCNIESDNLASLRLFRSRKFQRVGCKQAWNWSPDGWKDEWLFQRLLQEEPQK